jgi:hypothetical protein
MASARVAQLASSEAALASIFERRGAFWSVMGPLPVLAALVVGWGAWSAYSTLSGLPASVPNSVRIEVLAGAATGPFLILGLTISLPLALLVGRFSYARNVRPKLAARPPRYAGAPMRCRACGADLPQTRDAFVGCAFCQTQNVLASEVARDAARRLDEELAGYRAQASGVLVGTSRSATHMTRTVLVCFALVYAGTFAVGAVVRGVLGALG